MDRHTGQKTATLQHRLTIDPRSIVFDITPVPAPRMTRRDTWPPFRPAVSRYYAFRDEMRLKANLSAFELLPGMNYVFTIPMPGSWSKKKTAAMDGRPHTQTPDLDNCLKAVWDALLTEDKAMWAIGSAEKRWGQSGCIEVC